MELVDPRAKPAFQVRVLGGDARLRAALIEELLDLRATDDDLAKMAVSDADIAEPGPEGIGLDAIVWLATAAPTDADRARLTELKTSAHEVYVAALPSK